MRIGFDISDLTGGRSDGTTRYTYELAKRLPELAPEHKWLYFSPGQPTANYPLPVAGYQLHTSPWPRYWTQSRLPFDLYKHQPDVLLMPIQQLPFMRPNKMKTVAVVHDLAFHEFGAQYTYKDWFLQHLFSSYAARHADQLICVSQATAADVARYYGRTENVHVVHHGVDHDAFKPADEDTQAQGWRNLQNKYSNLKQPFILYVGQLQPRKNITGLVEAFEELHDNGLQLVIAGGHGWLQESILKRIDESPLRDDILLLGRVPNEVLPALYQNAAVFVLPSFYEGFGLPIIEAMAVGCPVVTSNVSCMPEIAGDAAVLVDPDDIRSITGGIEQAMQRQDELRLKGMARADEFSWDATAQHTLRVLLSKKT